MHINYKFYDEMKENIYLEISVVCETFCHIKFNHKISLNIKMLKHLIN